MQVVILAGGLGSRLSEETHSIPKPMVRIGKKPIIAHIIDFYSSYNFSEVIVAAGYKFNVISQFFAGNFKNYPSVQVIDTGLETQTAGRLARLSKIIKGDFMLTYGDGLSDVNLDSLIRFHYDQKRLATITAVHPPARFGSLELNGNQVRAFHEKSPVLEGWINGGFMVFKRDVLALITEDSVVLENDLLPRLAITDQLSAFRHSGWWYAMDTLRDKRTLNSLWDVGTVPWLQKHH